MLVKLIRWLRGYVDFRAYGKFPERFINLTNKNGINIWNAKPQEGGLSASMFLFDYKNIRTLAGKAKLRTAVTKRYGLPFVIEKYKSRIGILIGAVIGLLIIAVLSNFIWIIEVTPTENISSQAITELLEENGIYTGCYKNNIDVQKIERNSILSLDKIGWMSINITGNSISVKLTEKTPKPETTDNATPCNIKASADGVITDIKTAKGVTQVLKGSGVTKGELLVSGIVETKRETIEYVHATAEIYADVYTSEEITIPKSFVYNSITENKAERYICRFICFEFPCSFSFNTYENSVQQYKRENLSVNGKNLPITVITQCENEIIQTNAAFDITSAQQIALDKSVLYEIFKKPDSILKERNITINEDDSSYVAEIIYLFNENIAQTSEFSVTE